MATGVESSIELIEKLKLIAAERPGIVAGLFIRHAHRPDLDESTGVGVEVPLTEEGVICSEKFGTTLKGIVQPCQILSSPMVRCQQTGKNIAKGAEWSEELVKTSYQLVGYETVCTDLKLAAKSIVERREVNCMNTWIEGDVPPGFRDINDGSNRLYQFVKSIIDESSQSLTSSLPHLNIFVSHDTMLAPLIHKCFSVEKFEKSNWPAFAEAILFVRNEQHYDVFWRDKVAQVPH